MLFQMMFAIITPALITGAFAERKRFSTFIIFVLAWATLVYDPLAHWVWGVGGWLRNLGALDFAGGTVVHISSGVSALAAALVIGKRKGYGHQPMPPHNLPMTVMGAGLLWFGWFGFNAGSALGANGLAAHAFTTTNTAAAAAALGGVHRVEPARVDRAGGRFRRRGRPRGRHARRRFVTPMASVIIGALPAFSLHRVQPEGAVRLRRLARRVGVHGWADLGAIATGLFATRP